MESHQPYHEIFRRNWNFRVEYHFLPFDRDPPRLVYQGTRFDFRYAVYGKNKNFMIWPEFEDQGGFLILGKWIPIAPSGTARMWILNQNFVAYHREHLQLGTTGYIISGNDKIAECQVIELNF